MEERKKPRFFQQDFNLIELGCTLKKVGLPILQMFIALDFTSTLTLNLNNNFPYPKKTGSKQTVGWSDDTAVLLIGLIGLGEVQFHFNIL